MIDQPVLRQKLAGMAGMLERAHSMLEDSTHQMNVMPYKEQSEKLGGPIATTAAATRPPEVFAGHQPPQRRLRQSGDGL